MELISRDEAIKQIHESFDNQGWEFVACVVEKMLIDVLTIEERKVGKWIRTGRTNVYGGEELMCPFCGDRVMVQYIEYELYCRQCGALLGDRVIEEDEGE